jgi:hypothetical protein
LRDFSFRQLQGTPHESIELRIYAKDVSLQKLHDNVADFIRRTSRGAQ